MRSLFSGEPKIFRISARNSLRRSGKQYQFRDLLSYLSFLSNRKTLILVKSLLERLASNFSSLKELCWLSAKELEVLQQNFENLVSIEFKAHLDNFNKNLAKEEVLTDPIPEIDISNFTLPSPIGTLGPYEYAQELVSSLSAQSRDILSEFVQNYQASIYRAFNERFEKQIDKFNRALQNRVNEFEAKFGVTTRIQAPKLDNILRISYFNPSAIEGLKPLSIRVWFEKVLPGIFVRDVKFWSTPISLKAGPLSIKIGIPIGVKGKREMIQDVQSNIQDQAINIMNEYVYESLDNFVKRLYEVYSTVLNNFSAEWEVCLRNYSNQVEVAKLITTPEAILKIDQLIVKFKRSLELLSLS